MLRIKTDENMPRVAVEALRAAGHDVMTVADQQLTGSGDGQLAETCAQEGRIVVTLDRGFADPSRQRALPRLGVVVLRPATNGPRGCMQLLGYLLPALAAQDPTGCVWVVTAERIRVRRG